MTQLDVMNKMKSGFKSISDIDVSGFFKGISASGKKKAQLAIRDKAYKSVIKEATENGI